MVELLVVIAIIAVLASLLLAGVLAVNRRITSASRRSDLEHLTGALSKFYHEHGFYPPSRIVLVENGDYSFKSGMTPDDRNLVKRSARYLKKIFPDIQLRRSDSEPPGDQFDWDGNEVIEEDVYIILDGDHCLVFFLGGIPQYDDSGEFLEVKGFISLGSNPAPPPISLSTIKDDALDQSRKSFLNFSDVFKGRLVLSPFIKMPVLVDPESGADEAPVYYFSSYEGSGYDRNDVKGVDYYARDQKGLDPYQPGSYQIIFPGPDGQAVGGPFPPAHEKDKDNLTNFSTKRLGKIKESSDL